LASAGAIATFAGIIFVLPGLVGVLSNSLKNSINPYLPSNAASAFFTTNPDPSDHFLHPWAGFAVFCGYAAVLLAGAAVLLVRRDV
jgi:ABC-2 type transport system permease protein